MLMDVDTTVVSRSQLEFDHFVEASADRLLRAAYLITWDLAEAEDLVQECLLRVARRWPRVRGMEHRTAYARTVLVHLALDEGRHRSRRRAELRGSDRHPLEEHEDAASAGAFGRVEASRDLVRSLGALPPRQRAALVLRYFEDLSEAQAAEVMGCSVGTVKSTTSRALERLRADGTTGAGRRDAGDTERDTHAGDTDAGDTDAGDTKEREAAEAAEGA